MIRSSILTRRAGLVVGSFFFAAALSLVPFALADSEKGSSTTTGSGGRYQTSVDRKTEGELSDEDLRQVSLLASRIVKHVNRATEHLTDEETEKAEAEIESAQTLSKIVREMLPVTVVSTVVKDSSGKEVYRNTDRVQDDQIPIFERTIAVEVVEPIEDAKKEKAGLKGIRLADADLVRTSILLDLSYVERKLKRCRKLLGDKPDEALAQLVLAQNTGVRFVTNKEDHPLVEAQLALRVAQRMVENERYEAANANLQTARNHLELYRGLIGKSADERVKDLDKDLQVVMSEIEKPEAAKKIRGFWDRLTAWFRKEAGQTRSTETEAHEKEALVGSESK